MRYYRIVSDDDGIGVIIQTKTFLWPFWSDLIFSPDKLTYKHAWFLTVLEAKEWLEREFLPGKFNFKTEVQL